MSEILKHLDQVLAERLNAPDDRSYVGQLHSKGLNKILEKIGEEATETILAAKDGDSEDIIKETADLWFHSLVMLSHVRLDSQAVLNELQRRFGTSGIDEKASRPTT